MCSPCELLRAGGYDTASLECLKGVSRDVLSRRFLHDIPQITILLWHPRRSFALLRMTPFFLIDRRRLGLTMRASICSPYELLRVGGVGAVNPECLKSVSRDVLSRCFLHGIPQITILQWLPRRSFALLRMTLFFLIDGRRLGFTMRPSTCSPYELLRVGGVGAVNPECLKSVSRDVLSRCFLHDFPYESAFFQCYREDLGAGIVRQCQPCQIDRRVKIDRTLAHEALPHEIT